MVLHSSSSSSSLGDKASNNSASKFADDPSFFGSVLDQLHAEQKGTIEALSCQVEFYRQREERTRQELQTLRRCLPLGKDGSNASASVAKLASENRALGEELDTARAQQNYWDKERAKLERQKKELEKQLRDAKKTLTGFSQAIEQLEIKMQRKEAEVQTRCIELEHELQDKAQECDRLQQEMENLQTASEENERLKAELQSLLGGSGPSSGTTEIKSVRDKIHKLEQDNTQQEKQIQDLQSKLVTSTAEVATAELEIERKNSEIKEMRLKLDNTTDMMLLREQLQVSDDSSRKEIEAQQQELLALVSTLQREKEDLQARIASLQRELDTTRTELQTTKSRLSVKDHSVMVSTLRREVASLKERLRSEFMHEKESMRNETQSLKQDLTALRGRLAEKDLVARNLEAEVVRGEEKQKQAAYDIRQLQERIRRLELELDQSKTKFQQLQQCRTALAEQLDFGFKELLNDEESAATAHEELEKLRVELNHIKKENAALEEERRTLTEELERSDRQTHETSTRQSEKIDDLYRQLLGKEETLALLKQAERQVSLLEQEKESWEGNVTDIRLRCEARVEAEVRKAEGLRARIDQLEQDKQSLKQHLDSLEDEGAKSDERAQLSDLALRQKDQELESLQREIARLDGELATVTQSFESGRQERSSLEQKLLNERKTMEREVAQLVRRIESAGKRNFELGEKVITIAKQAKVDQTDLVALSSQVKSYKDQVKTLENELGQVCRHRGNDSDAVRDLQQKLIDLACLKESYQVEIDKLRQMLEHVRSDYNVVKQQRDEAVKRVRLLVQSREDMKTAVEDHTTELVEEIEALQHQLDSERKRCAVLLGNEKTLLRELQERNAAVTKLEHTVSALQRQQANSQRSRRQSHERSSNAGTPVSSSNHSTAPTTTSSSPQRHRSQQQLRSSSTSSCGSFVTPATKEMDHLLSNLERISDFSAQVQQLQR